MKHTTASKNWLFEIKEVRAIKTKKYGDAYSAIKAAMAECFQLVILLLPSMFWLTF